MTISIVLYGRNDNYGYNLHKRAALSLNCMAEVLTDSSDEILFVDYNTPDDFPTFPEAIQDTLTQRARDILRIFRVRSRIHQRFKSKTQLVALEPIARNVAVRRSCPANRWILSTNTDVIFVPHGVNSLSKIAEGLAPGFYHAPRIEIPEVLWESLDRQAPADIITTVRGWGSTLHLNEIILGAEFIIYDGPGDFQLLLRDDLFNNYGFHEEMLLGWHVDSNIAMRMYKKYGKVGDLGTEVYGYHCDHTRQVTPAHSHARLQNDWRRFCAEVDRPDVPEQATTWGCANDTIEELRLVANPASTYVQTLLEAVGSPLTEPQVSEYTHLTFNRTDYDPRHMVPFLADMFVSMPKNSNLVWYGAGVEMLSRFAIVWDRLEFTGKIIVDPELIRQNDPAEAIEFGSTLGSLDRVDAFIFDFGGLPGNKQVSDGLLRRFLEVVREERRRLSVGMSPRRFMALNAINNQFQRLVDSYIAAAATPCGTHMRHGFVWPARSKEDWLPLLHPGRAGVRVGNHIESDPRNLGVIAYGPYKYLDAGYYRLSIKAALSPEESESGGNEPCIVIQVHAGDEVFGVYLLCRSALAKPDHEFFFAVPRTAAGVLGDIETRIELFGRVALSIQGVTIESIPASSDRISINTPLLSPPLALKIENWLPYLSIGPLGRADDAGIIAQRGSSDFVISGPYWALPSGYYELVIHIERESEGQSLKHVFIRADVMMGDQQLVGANFRLDACAATTIRLPFEMGGNSSNWRQMGTRIWSSGEECFLIRALSVKPLEQLGHRELIPYLLLGEVGRRVSFGIKNIEGRSGTIAYSPNMRFSPGPYRMIFVAEVTPTGHKLVGSQTCAIALVKHGTEILEVNEISSTAGEVKEHQLLFEVPSDPDPFSGIEFFFRAVRAGDINLYALKVEAIETTPERRCPAVLTITDWLPFLQNGKSAHPDEGGVVVTEGVDELAVYGPCWTLPAGRYEMRALIVPNPQGRDRGAVVTAQVTAEGGARAFVEGKWRLGQYELIDATPAVEFRLPFSLSGDLPPAARTIETRIFTPGNASFRILSLAVTAKGDQPEANWFPYLIVGECGVHTSGEIKGIEDKIGYIARTPPIRLVPGHYRVSPDMRIEPGVRGKDTVAVEVWSGSDLIAVEPMNSGRDKRLEFDVANEFSGNDIELRIRALAPTEFSIHCLSVEKISDAIEQGALPAVLRLKNWLPFLEVGLAARRVGRSVLARYAQSGYVVDGPYWSLPAGNYVMRFTVELDETETAAAGTWLRSKNAIKMLLLFAKVLHDGDADVVLDGRQIALLEGFTIGSFFNRSSTVWLPFEIGVNDIKIGSRLETRVWSTGRRGFRIRSLTVQRGMPNERIYKRKNWALFRIARAKLVDRIRRLAR